MTAVEAGARYSSPRSTTASELMARSRLQVPQVTPYHLSRDRLSGLLSSNPAPLTLLSAPAGSGKTALAAEWAHRLGRARRVVWVDCHSGAADPWADILRGMGAGDLAEGSNVAQVIEMAHRSSRPWTVFLDGYALRSAEAAEELDHLLSCAGAGLRVVLTTRADPILPLHRYRLGGNLLEIRAADLGFTDAEADALLRTGGVELGADDLHALNTRLAGWAAGLRFALPALARHPAPQALVSSAVTYDGNINAYLVTEVLDAQPPALRRLILATSVPDALTPDLLEELTGEPAVPTMLRLRNANVFLESTPDDQSCARYMPFFRDLVRAQLAYEAPGRLRELHRRVATWHARGGRWDSAVRHLGCAGERPDCAALLVEHLLVGRVLCERRGDPFRRLVADSPSRTPVRPGEHLLAAVTALADGDHAGCSAHLEAARATGLRPGRAAVTGAVLEAVLASRTGDPLRAEGLAARAEGALAAERHPVDPGADDSAAVLLLARARAAIRLGAVRRADRLLGAALDSGTASWSTAYRSSCLAHAAVLHARTGAVSRAVDEADAAVAVAGAGVAAPALVATTAHLGRACAALAEGDLAGARAHLKEATTDHPEPLWQVVHAIVAAALERSAGAVAAAAARLDAAAGAAALAGPWPADWVREEMTHLGTAGRQPGGVHPRAGSDGRVVEPLTPRELEVLLAMSEWLTTKEIAEKLFVSVNTVRTHVRSILTKLGVSRRNAAIREAVGLGLLAPDLRVVTLRSDLPGWAETSGRRDRADA